MGLHGRWKRKRGINWYKSNRRRNTVGLLEECGWRNLIKRMMMRRR